MKKVSLLSIAIAIFAFIAISACKSPAERMKDLEKGLEAVAEEMEDAIEEAAEAVEEAEAEAEEAEAEAEEAEAEEESH